MATTEFADLNASPDFLRLPSHGGTILVRLHLARLYELHEHAYNNLKCVTTNGAHENRRYHTSYGVDSTSEYGNERAGSDRKHVAVFSWNQDTLLPYEPTKKQLSIVIKGEDETENVRTLGRVNIDLNLLMSWGLQWHPVYGIGMNSSDNVGEILVDVFPTVPKSAGPIVRADTKSEAAWFWELKKKREKNKYQNVRDFVAKFVANYVPTQQNPGDNEAKSESEDLLQVLELLKSEKGRSLVQAALLRKFVMESYMKQPLQVSEKSLQTLSDIMFASMREANNKGDYHACKIFLDISYLYCAVKATTDDNSQTVFLYSRLKRHEVFRNTVFWENVFHDVYQVERAALQDSSWQQLSAVEQERYHSHEESIVSNLLLVFAMQMVNSCMEASEIVTLVRKLCRVYNLRSDEALCTMVQHIVNVRSAPLSNETPSHEMMRRATGSARNRGSALYLSANAEANYAASSGGGGSGGNGSSTGTMVAMASTADDGGGGGDGMRRRSMIGEPVERGVWRKYTVDEDTFFYHNVSTNEITQTPPMLFQVDEKAMAVASPTVVDKIRVARSPALVLGEVHMESLSGVELLMKTSKWGGTLYLTNYRVCFMTFDPLISSVPANKPMTSGSVHSLSKVDIEENVLVLHFKDVRTIRVQVIPTMLESAANFVTKIRRVAWPPSPQGLFAFQFRDPVTHAMDGWNLYDVKIECARLGVISPDAVSTAASSGGGRGSAYQRHDDGDADYWQISDINATFQYAPTYCRHLIVPADFTEEDFGKLRKFRSKGRIPSLCFRYRPTGAIMLRSSQPLVGIVGKRNSADEKLLRLCNIGVIIDCRPKANAVANQAKGGGYENVTNYGRAELKFMGIENIHAVRDSLSKVENLVGSTSPESSDYMAQLDATHWLHHQRSVLVAAASTAQLMENYTSVLVHCLSDDHEILTNHGFLSMRAMRAQMANDPTLLVAGYNVHTAQMQYERPLRFIRNTRRQQRMIRFNIDDVGVVVTPDHDMYVKCDMDTVYKKMKARDVMTATTSVRVLARPPNGCAVASSSSRSSEYLRAYGRNALTVHDDTMTTCFDSWVFTELSTPQLRTVIDGMQSVSTLPQQLRTQSTRMRDELVRLCVTAGYAAEFHMDGDDVWWCVSYDDDHDVAEPLLYTHNDIEYVEYTGDTWCVSMPTGYIFARRCCEGGMKASKPVLMGNCSDGWDRTAQVCSISQLLLDPYYRTLRGFCVLIQKEWCSYGHKFTHRCGHGDSNHGSHERSPIFVQCLDAVWQVLQQYPCSFEFTPQLLAYLAEHAYKCKFGTFLFNNERERFENQVKTRTVSIWTHVLREERFRNAYYRERRGALYISTDPRHLQLWPYYYRTDETMRSKESFANEARRFLRVEQESNVVRMEWYMKRIRAWQDYVQDLRALVPNAVAIPPSGLCAEDDEELSVDQGSRAYANRSPSIPVPTFVPPPPPRRPDAFDASAVEYETKKWAAASSKRFLPPGLYEEDDDDGSSDGDESADDEDVVAISPEVLPPPPAPPQ